MFSKTQKLSIWILLAVILCPSSNATTFSGLSPLTRLVTSDAVFTVTASNFFDNATFDWMVDDVIVGNVTKNGANFVVTSEPGYNLSPSSSSPSQLIMTFTITNLQISNNGSTIKVVDDVTSANTTLTVKENCGPAPVGDGCSSLNCQSNSTTFFGQPSDVTSIYSNDCYNTTTCGADAQWSSVMTKCGNSPASCQIPGVWGANCTKTCGMGCPYFLCSMNDGRCLNETTLQPITNPTCLKGYNGNNCENPICGDCNGGECLAPNFCGNCPIHFSSGPTCRNIRLDGFVKGSLPTFAILTVIVILLSVSSKWYIRRKLKLN